LTVKGFTEQRWKVLYEGGWRPSTKATNDELLDIIFARFADVPLADVDTVALQSWLNDLAKKRSRSAILHLRIFVRSIFAEAEAQRYIDTNPARHLGVPKTRPPKRPFLKFHEMRKLLAEAKAFGVPTNEWLFLQIVFGTAMRPSEALALRWRSVDLEKGVLTVSESVYRGVVREYTKTEEEPERLLLPEYVTQALTEVHAQREPKDDDFIFGTSENTPVRKENWLRRNLQPIADRAGIGKLNYQQLRRSTATHLSRHGDPRTIQAVLRHKRLSTTTGIYMQQLDDAVRQTIESFGDALNAPDTVKQG
jgi:integrase